jgi:hypothetical protein
MSSKMKLRVRFEEFSLWVSDYRPEVSAVTGSVQLLQFALKTQADMDSDSLT